MKILFWDLAEEWKQATNEKNKVNAQTKPET